MKVLVIGATQGVGLEVLKQGLDAGHEVTVLARTPSKIDIHHPSLHVIKGDALDETSVANAVQGQDAVIHSIGVKPSRQPITAFSDSTRILMSAMKRVGAKRLVVVTGLGAGDSKGHGGFFYDKLLQPLLLNTIYQDKDRQEALLFADKTLDWTIVRPGFLSNGKHTGQYRLTENMKGFKAGKISRSDVAAYLLTEAQSPRYTHKVVFVD